MPPRGDADVVASKRAGDGSGERGDGGGKRMKVLPGLHAAREDASVSKGWAALLEAAAGTNGGRARQLAALIELERRSKLITSLGRAEEVLQVCSVFLDQEKYSHVRAFSVYLSISLFAHPRGSWDL